MAEIGKLSIKIRVVPDDETMTVILKLLDLWQDDNPDKMVEIVPQRDRYGYEIVDRKGGKLDA